jgi:hypothetical protein
MRNRSVPIDEDRSKVSILKRPFGGRRRARVGRSGSTAPGASAIFRGSFLLLSLLACRAAVAEPSVDLPLEMKPYRVQLFVGVDAPQQSARVRNELLEEIRRAAGRCIGSQWSLAVDEAEWLQPVGSDGVSRLTVSDMRGHCPPEMDVWLVAAVQSRGSGWRIDVRSWQPAVGVESDTLSAETYDRLDVPLILLQQCHSAFRPIGVVDEVDGKQVRVVLQAGALSVPDESFSLTRAAKLFAPVLAARKRDGTIDRLQPIPWTYLTAGESRGGRVTCELHSGLRSPIGGKRRGRVETLAIAVKSTHPSTHLELATQSKPSLPLVAHRIELRRTAEIPKVDAAKDKNDKENKDNQDEQLLKVLLTDRRGHVTLPADSEGSVIWLFAYSGRHLLARVPIVPGMAPRMRLEVPDDSSRLEAESDLYMLQGQLIEAVAARNTAVARIRAAVKKNDAIAAKAAAEDLRKLPDVQFYLDRVAAIRVPALKAAKSRRDRAGESRINRMCDETNELIRQYLNEDKRQAVYEELKELHSEDQVDTAPPPEPVKP